MDDLTRLELLDVHWQAMPQAGVEESEGPLTGAISVLQAEMRRPQRRVTFLGAYKSGKTTLLNALVGTTVLPTRANRATGAVTELHYAAEPSASIVRRTPEGKLDEEPVPFDDVADYILLDVSGPISKPIEGIEEVIVRVPCPLLELGWVLVDTPGLLDNQHLTDRSEQELGRSDLAIMVLAADKLVGSAERGAAEQVDAQLNGNLAFVVNRLDLVADDEQDDVIEWARSVVSGVGNDLVGESRIFALSAARALEDKLSGDLATGDIRELGRLEEWLAELMRTSTGQTVAALSRLGVLRTHLDRERSQVQAQLAEVQTRVDALRAGEAGAREQHASTLRLAVRVDRLNLSRVRDGLQERVDEFQADWLSRTKTLMESDREWAQAEKLQHCFDEVLAAYAHGLFFDVSSAMEETDMRVPPLEADTLREGIHLTAQDESYDGATAGAATTLGMFLGGPVGAFLFGGAAYLLTRTDAKQKTLEAIAGQAVKMEPTLLTESEAYLDRVDAALDDYMTSHTSDEWISPQLQESTRRLSYLYDLRVWCDYFIEAVDGLRGTLGE